MASSFIGNNTSISASIAVGKWSTVCYLKHHRSVGVVAHSEVSVLDANSCTIGEVPVGRRVTFGGTKNVHSSHSKSRYETCRLEQSITIVTKLSDHRIKHCTGQCMTVVRLMYNCITVRGRWSIILYKLHY